VTLHGTIRFNIKCFSTQNTVHFCKLSFFYSFRKNCGHLRDAFCVESATNPCYQLFLFIEGG
jgi:hypothetical protein